MRSQTCSISALVAWGRIEMIIYEDLRNKKPTLSSGLVQLVCGAVRPTPLLPGPADMPAPQLKRQCALVRHRNNSIPKSGDRKQATHAFPYSCGATSRPCI